MILTRAAMAVAAVAALGSGAVFGAMTASSAAGPSAAASSSSASEGATGASGATGSEGATGATGAKGDADSAMTTGMGLPPDGSQKTSNGLVEVSKVATKNPVFFLTIDDGWSQPKSLTDYVARTKVPITSFLTNDAAQGNFGYFSKVSAYDAVQNHTMDHKALSKTSTDLDYEICDAQKKYEAKYGSAPDILRPPYGAGFMPRRDTTSNIEKTAKSCGIKAIALWNVTVSKNGKIAFAGTPYQKGDIVLFHFEGDIAANIDKVVKEYAKHGLKPASLQQYLIQ